MNHYRKFALMILTSTLVMFFLMYLNVYELSHVYFSQTRAYMAVVMGAAMAMVMLAFMMQMLKSWKANLGIVALSITLFALSLWLVRSQTTVDDAAWMKGMIPHHSIAILTSERARLKDPRVRKLADDIIRAQKREIEEMKTLLQELGNSQP